MGCEQFCPAGKCESENDMKNEEGAACSRCQKKHNNDTPCEQFCPAGKCKDDDDMKKEECADCSRCQKKHNKGKMAPSLLQARDKDPCEQFCPTGKCESENDMKNEECAACTASGWTCRCTHLDRRVSG